MCFKHRSGLLIREVEDETVILDRDSEKIHQLNKLASFIWNKLDGNNSINQIAEQIVEQFDVTIDMAKNDIENLLEEFKKINLLVKS